MAVRLTVERKVIPGTQGRVAELLMELRSAAVLQPGFISGETIVDVFNPTIIMTVSRWVSLLAWEEWERDPRRLEITNRLDAMLQSAPTARLWRDDADIVPPALLEPAERPNRASA